jgi:hypothetical protein
MGRLHWIGPGAGGLMLALASTSPAAAQSLSRGDYERCAVYRGGDFRGYDSVCLARRRAALRHYDNDGQDRRSSPRSYSSGVYHCPINANQGRGWQRLNGYGTVDSPVNGRPCVPRPVNYLDNGYY